MHQTVTGYKTGHWQQRHNMCTQSFCLLSIDTAVLALCLLLGEFPYQSPIHNLQASLHTLILPSSSSLLCSFLISPHSIPETKKPNMAPNPLPGESQDLPIRIASQNGDTSQHPGSSEKEPQMSVKDSEPAESQQPQVDDADGEKQDESTTVHWVEPEPAQKKKKKRSKKPKSQRGKVRLLACVGRNEVELIIVEQTYWVRGILCRCSHNPGAVQGRARSL